MVISLFSLIGLQGFFPPSPVHLVKNPKGTIFASLFFLFKIFFILHKISLNFWCPVVTIYPFFSNSIKVVIPIEIKRLMAVLSPVLQFEYQMNADGQIEDH